MGLGGSVGGAVEIGEGELEGHVWAEEAKVWWERWGWV